MNRSDLYLNNTNLILEKRIGRGGEGEVYTASNLPGHAIKLYTDPSNALRNEKVIEMVRSELFRGSKLVAFPNGIVTTRLGDFRGFSMPLVKGHRPIHELYGPKSRKTHFPNADFRFLIRAATNISRSVGQVHESRCVIGDINHSGILVSGDATISLIDADSFQFDTATRRFPCVVGVPDFTPPELQGTNLGKAIRQRTHDYFGLAVAIFQLLFMGRHPYAGRFSGSEMSLDQAIANNLFAYSKRRSNGMTHPDHAPTLDDFPDSIRDGFERAFGIDPLRRPTPNEWISALVHLERHLNRCGMNSSHYYPSSGTSCPWCRMETSAGIVLFVGGFSGTTVHGNSLDSFDIEATLRDIDGAFIPQLNSLNPIFSFPAKTNSPSHEAISERKITSNKGLIGAGLIAASVVGALIFSSLFLLFIIPFVLGLTLIFSCHGSSKGWLDKYSTAEREFFEGLERWRHRSPVKRAHDLKYSLLILAADYKQLCEKHRDKIAKHEENRRNRKLSEYLDNFLISNASISGIGYAKTATLASYGVETASDVTRSSIMRIPGFGSATTSKLLSWRSSIEKRFVYNAAPDRTDVLDRQRLDSEFHMKARAMIVRLNTGAGEIRQTLNSLPSFLSAIDSDLIALATRLNQAESDLLHLKLNKPMRFQQSGAPAFTKSMGSFVGSSSGTTGSEKWCPACGSTMVRKATHGGRGSGCYWICSRNPVCTGARSG